MDNAIQTQPAEDLVEAILELAYIDVEALQARATSPDTALILEGISLLAIMLIEIRGSLGMRDVAKPIEPDDEPEPSSHGAVARHSGPSAPAKPDRTAESPRSVEVEVRYDHDGHLKGVQLEDGRMVALDSDRSKLAEVLTDAVGRPLRMLLAGGKSVDLRSDGQGRIEGGTYSARGKPPVTISFQRDPSGEVSRIKLTAEPVKG